jgi:hypothetical protein
MSRIPVRPSSLQLAEQCLRAPWLATKYPSSYAATRFGSAVDKQVTIILSCMLVGDTDNLPTEEELLPETSKILEWLEANYPVEQWQYFVQEKVTLRDPETGAVLTAGTPDLMCLHRTEPRFVDVDWKKRGQLWAGHLPPPDENLQQLAYVAAFWLETAQSRPIEQAKIVLCCWDAWGVTPQESGGIREDRLREVVERVRAVPKVDVDGPQPEAAVGEQCDHCWSRMHCDAHLLPMAVAIKAGLPAPFAEFTDQPLTVETTVKALGWLEGADRVLREAKKIRDLVENNIDAFVMQNGPVEVDAMMYGPVISKPRRMGATVEILKAIGREDLIRLGDAKITCKWTKAPPK